MSDAKNKLSRAAEALVEAATLEVDSLTQKKLANEMKEFNRNLTKLSLDMDKNTGCFDELKKIVEKQSSEISKVHDNINTVNHNLNGIKNIMEQQLKIQKLSNAIVANAHVGSFEYKDQSRYPEKTNSKEFVHTILQSFVNGFGKYIPNTYYIGSGYMEKEREAFRAQLKSQVITLIGREPRLVKESNGQYAIYYS